jgi:hypothetical protein
MLQYFWDYSRGNPCGCPESRQVRIFRTRLKTKKSNMPNGAFFFVPAENEININRDFGQPQGLPLPSKMIATFFGVQVASRQRGVRRTPPT